MRRLPDIEVHSNLVEFFKEQVQGAIKNQHVETGELAEYYLVQLLSEYHAAEKLHRQSRELGNEEPFAITYLKAINTDGAQRMNLLRGLGDRSLYITGMFAEHIENRSVGLDYYISIGGNAYTGVADLMGNLSADMRGLFNELSQKFSIFVDIISEISASAGLQKDTDLLKVYDRYLRTGSDRAAKLLTKAGIPLTTVDPEEVQ